ncbi:hypothetical protein SAY87_020701 [Trapa incisa]|uniref:separase n=1 Tax=Trapa incisa TaxID=236973 RepID=A0AAN7JR38_9MYRT|nr:hypothetical protein SAY87_020701 [Trapa incisa]
MIPDSKVERKESEIELVELVYYCASKCQNAGNQFCSKFSANIKTLVCKKVHKPIDLILELYAIGLCLSDVKIKLSDSTARRGEEDVAALRLLISNTDRLNGLSSVLGKLDRHFQIECNDDSHGRTGSCKYVFPDSSLVMKHTKEGVHFLLYMNALKFLCQPLSELINTERKHILAGNEADTAVTVLHLAQDALNTFCSVFLFHCREKNGFEEHSKVLLGAAVAAFTLSLITKHNLKNLMKLIEHTINSEWVQQQGLKFLLSSLHNIAVVLYRNKLVKEASKALKLSCLASWTCVMIYCQCSELGHCGTGDFSEDTVIDFINEACTRSAFYLDLLDQQGNKKIGNVILATIKSWSTAYSNFSLAPCPLPLVKQWVKIQCREQKGCCEKKSSTLCELLLNSGDISKGILVLISEQEILAYKEMSSWLPDVCNKMKMRITNVLIDKVCLQDNVSRKARLLIERGVAMGLSGIASLNECIECLSATACQRPQEKTLERHLLATAHCLKALCLQESDPRSKGILQNISAALNYWSSIFNSVDCSLDELSNVLSEVSFTLLFNILDLLALKGCFAFHLLIEVWKIIFNVFKWKNIPLERCLSSLWECRRMSHALCASPISKIFLRIISKVYEKHCESIDCWINSLMESRPLIVGFQNCFSLTFPFITQGSLVPENLVQIDISEVKQTFLALVSSVPVNVHSNYVAGCLLYDLGERLVLNGRLHEALIFAKEAHRLRTKLFQQKFKYSIEQHAEKYNEVGEVTQNCKYSIMDLQLSRPVNAEVWTVESSTRSVEDCYISPWSVLQAYLESTLQVGTIHDLIGNGTEAETFYLWGGDISHSQDLQHFSVAFSSALGKLYSQKKLWSLATKELENAKQILMNCCQDRSRDVCSKCCLLLEANINLQLGNLFQSQVDRTARIICRDKLSEAENLFRSTLDKLHCFDWDHVDIIPVKEGTENPKMSDATDVLITNTAEKQVAGRTKILPARERDVKIEITKGRKGKNVAKPAAKEHSTTTNVTKRVTRSRLRSSNQSNESLDDSGPQLDDTKNGAFCTCNNMKCLQCLINANKSGLLNNYIDIRWEICRRRISAWLLIGIGKCIETLDGIHAMHRVFLESISKLVGRNTYDLSNTAAELLENVGKIMAIECATVLCSISRFLLKSYPKQSERKKCCSLAQVQLSQIVSWLKLSFVLCLEVPTLLQEVARLLAITFIYSASCVPLSTSCNALSENYWASFFHQASIGSHLNNQVSLHIIQKTKGHNEVVVGGYSVTDSSSIKAEMFNLPRLVPESVKELDDYVKRFSKSLPHAAIICVSILGGLDSCLLQELFPSSSRAWMLFSRLNSEDQPIVLLQPLDPILEDSIDDGSSSSEIDRTCSGRHWHCSWGSTVIDDIIPTYKDILEENYLSSSFCPLEDTKENRLSWWKRRKTLDLRLNKLLRKLEDFWFGPWRHLLLGGFINSCLLDALHKRLMHDLKSKCKVDANEALLRVILGSVKSNFDVGYFTSLLHSKSGCHISSIAQHDEDGQDKTSVPYRADKFGCLASQLVYQGITELELEDYAHREPIILVLDSELQMFPWENMPVLRNQEVYRMPSVASILMTIDRSHKYQDDVGDVASAFPFIDPLDAFFLLNPGGDLKSTQVEFENWFRDHKLEGKAGSAPASKELADLLQQHDLFIYFGHGSGAQYIPRHEIQKLNTCAATLLMGCSSGALTLHGPYMPEGMPLSCLVAGSPAIIANLWEVTDKDIDRFGKAVLGAWLEARSKTSRQCAHHDSLAKEMEAADVREKNNCRGKKNRKKLPKNKPSPESLDCEDCRDDCGARIGSFMGRAREACLLPFLIGAAPVCYGVPTCIARKKDL